MKTKSEAAQVASIIRKHCKLNGIQCRITSSTYSGGNAVYINTVNVRPDKLESLRQYCRYYQSGHYDSMNDIYEYKKTSEISAKYIIIQSYYDDALMQECWNFIRTYYHGMDIYPASINDLSRVYIDNRREWALSLINYELSQKIFWEQNHFEVAA